MYFICLKNIPELCTFYIWAIDRSQKILKIQVSSFHYASVIIQMRK